LEKLAIKHSSSISSSSNKSLVSYNWLKDRLQNYNVCDWHLWQVLCQTASTCNELSQEEMWTHEQHPPEEEVKVDIAHLDVAVRRHLAYVSTVFVAKMYVGNQLATNCPYHDFSLDILITKYC